MLFSKTNSRQENRSKLSFTARIVTKCSLERFLSIYGEKMSKGFLKICKLAYKAISRKVVEKTVHATIPKGNMGYDQYTVPDTVAVESTFIAFL